MERKVYSTFESFKAQNEELSAGILHQEDVSILSEKIEIEKHQQEKQQGASKPISVQQNKEGIYVSFSPITSFFSKMFSGEKK